MSRRILITGGSSGLGLSLAHALAARGDTLALLARDAKKLEAAAEAVRAKTPGARVFTVACDVQDVPALETAFSRVVESMGGLDVLVNSAGVLREGYFESLDLATHREVMDINYFGTLHAIRAALPHLRRSGRGRIVNIASIAGLSGVFGYTAYCASKHALVGLTESLRFELEPQGLVVQLVCPGEFDSPMVDALDRSRTPENRAHAHTIPKVGVDVIVDTVVRGLEGEDFFLVPGTLAKLSVFALQHFPRVGRFLGDLRVRRAYVGPR